MDFKVSRCLKRLLTLHFCAHWRWHFDLTSPLSSIYFNYFEILPSNKVLRELQNTFNYIITLYSWIHPHKPPNPRFSANTLYLSLHQTNALYFQRNSKIRFSTKLWMIFLWLFILLVATLRITKIMYYHSAEILFQSLNILFINFCYCIKDW